MKEKFRPGDRVIANEKSPSIDYEGRAGTVLRREPGRSEYWVQFDGDQRGPGCLSSWMLDAAAAEART